MPAFGERFLMRNTRASIPTHIDADTANEIDDLYAIVRALLAPELEVRALSSAQWSHELSSRETVRESQALNEAILRAMNRVDIPTPIGSERKMGQPWGGDEARDSPAARSIIRNARAMEDGQKLSVITLGASTNIASAIKLAPDIVPKLSVYLLGAKYFADRQVWDKDEFNIRRDLNAFNFLLNQTALDLNLMPVNIIVNYRLRQREVVDRLAGKSAVWDLLANRWLSFSPGNAEWIMWDLALTQAVIHPHLAEKSLQKGPPENTERLLNVYTRIDIPGMVADWWETVDNH
jgi:purine nucleosidase